MLRFLGLTLPLTRLLDCMSPCCELRRTLRTAVPACFDCRSRPYNASNELWFVHICQFFAMVAHFVLPGSAARQSCTANPNARQMPPHLHTDILAVCSCCFRKGSIAARARDRAVHILISVVRHRSLVQQVIRAIIALDCIQAARHTAACPCSGAAPPARAGRCPEAV